MIKKFLYSLYSLLFNSLLLSLSIAIEIPYVVQQDKLIADFNQPSAVTMADHHIYVLDGLKQRIIVFSTESKQYNIIDLKLDKADLLSAPIDMLLTDSKIIIADTGNHRLVEYSIKGQFIQFIDLKKLSQVDQKAPEPVALRQEENMFYWSDRANHQICKMHLQDYKLIRCFGSYGEAEQQFRFPFQMATDRDSYLYAVDVLNSRVQIFNSRGKHFSQIGRFGLHPGDLFRPNGIAINQDDFVFISDSYVGHISVFKDGHFIGYLMDKYHKPLFFTTPVYLSLHNNILFVVDAINNSVIQLSLSYKSQEKEPSPQSLPDKHSSSGKNCITCHVSWEDKQHIQSLPIDDDPVLPVASEKMCYSCHHGVVVESRIAIKNKHQHPTIYSDKKNTILDPKSRSKSRSNPEQDSTPEEFPLSENDELLCTSCHSPHNSDEHQEVLYEGHKNSWMRISNRDGDLCEQCHESKRIGTRSEEKKGLNHPLGIKFLSAPTDVSTNDKHNTVLEKNVLENSVLEAHLQQGLPEELLNNGAMLDKQQQLICQTCHQIHAGQEKALLTLANAKSELCISCHKSKYRSGKKAAHQHGIHPVNIKLDKAIKYKGKTITQVTCASCHKVHNGQLNTALLSETAEQDIDTLCTTCHQRHTAKNAKEAAGKGIHPVNITLKKSIKINNKVVKKITCLSCHSVHQGKKQTASLVQSDKNGELCKNCHKEQQQVLNTDHDLRLTASKQKNRHHQYPDQAGLCGSCHSMHKGHTEKNQQAFLYAAKTVPQTTKQAETMDTVLLQRDQLCINCHQDKGIAKDKVVNHFSHPHQDMVLRSDKKKMPLLQPSKKNTTKLDLAIKENHEFGMIACVTCHNPHVWSPDTVKSHSKKNNKEGNGSNSFLRDTDVQSTFCVSCHGIESRLKYKYYHDKSNARNIGIDYLK